MMSDVKVIIAVAIITVLVIAAILYIRGVLGRPTRGVLHVPQGRNIVPVIVCQDAHLRPFKYDQTFDAVVVAGDTYIQNAYTGRRQTGECAIAFKNKPIGFVDSTDSFVLVLSKLANTYKKVTVKAVIISMNSNGQAVLELKLPDEKWFLRALKNTAERRA